MVNGQAELQDPRLVAELKPRSYKFLLNYLLTSAGAPPTQRAHPGGVSPLTQRSTLQNQGKTAVLHVLPPMAPLKCTTINQHFDYLHFFSNQLQDSKPVRSNFIG